MGVAVAEAPSAPTSLAAIEWGEAIVPPGPVPAAVEAEVRRHFGTVPSWVPYAARVPWVMQAMCRIVSARVTTIPHQLADLIAMVVSQDNSCRHCYGATRTLLRISGYREEYIVRLERDFTVIDLPPASRAALELARRVSRGHPRPAAAEFADAVRAGLSREALHEIVLLAGVMSFSNRVATLLAFPPEQELESIPSMPLFRFLRPVLAWRMRAAKPPPAPPAHAGGPWAGLIEALAFAPLAGVVQQTIEEAWASPVLPRRTKALVIAVIGKVLGCARAEAEARTLLAAEGMEPAELDQILAHLASPRLDPREARLVPFARETVRYQPGMIQRRVRAVMDGMSPEEVVEAAGILGLANALARMSVVLDAC